MSNHRDINSHWDNATGLLKWDFFCHKPNGSFIYRKKQQQSHINCFMYDQQSYTLKIMIFTCVDDNHKLIIISIKFFWKILKMLYVCLSSVYDGIQIMSITLIWSVLWIANFEFYQGCPALTYCQMFLCAHEINLHSIAFQGFPLHCVSPVISQTSCCIGKTFLSWLFAGQISSAYSAYLFHTH